MAVNLIDESAKWGSIAKAEDMYGDLDLSSCCLFAGGLINFGYYKSLSSSSLSINDRVESQKELYRHALSGLNITKNDKVLEVGCGLGLGCKLVSDEFQPKKITGIDLSQAQINRAKKVNEKNSLSQSISFELGRAEELPFKDQSFNVVYSIEAAQHFSDLNLFCNEAFRVLFPNGKLAIATFFAKNSFSVKPATNLIATAKSGADHFTPINTIRRMLAKAGFVKIQVKSIGENVWKGFDKWISQQDNGYSTGWNRNWLKCYQSGLLDYFIVTAEKEEIKGFDSELFAFSTQRLDVKRVTSEAYDLENVLDEPT